MYGLEQEYIGEGYNVPTFTRYCLSDPYFTDLSLFDDFQNRLSEEGIATDIKGVNAGHGFGLGSKTDAEGWTIEAEAFWKETWE